MGDDNVGSTVNFNGFVNTVQIEQTGNENLGLVEAVLDDGVAADANGVLLQQTGNQNDAAITLARVGQSNGNIVTAEQSGDLNILDLVINGSDNTVSIMQEGTGNWLTAEDGGTFQMMASDTTFNVTQVGNDNLVVGSITGTGGSVTVSQTGDFNVAVVNQM